MIDDSIRKLSSKIIDFDQIAFSSLIQENMLSDYFENGGVEFSLFCRNHIKETISFETEALFKDTDLNFLLDSFIQQGISEFQITINELQIIGFSGYYPNCWIVVTGDDISFLKQVIEPIWYSVFEQ